MDESGVCITIKQKSGQSKSESERENDSMCGNFII